MAYASYRLTRYLGLKVVVSEDAVIVKRDLVGLVESEKVFHGKLVGVSSSQSLLLKLLGLRSLKLLVDVGGSAIEVEWDQWSMEGEAEALSLLGLNARSKLIWRVVDELP